MFPPTISIITVAHNTRPWLRQAIASVATQTHAPDEYLLIDDGSSDGSANIIRNSGFPHQCFAESRGFTLRLRDAIAATTGGYFGWLDSDDVLHPEAIAVLSAALDANPDAVAVCSQSKIMSADGVVKGLSRSHQQLNRDAMLQGQVCPHMRLVRRDAYNAINGLQLRYRYAQDHDLFLRLSEIGPIIQIQKSLHYYRDRPGSISRSRRLTQLYYQQRAALESMDRTGDRRQLRMCISYELLDN